MSSSQDLFCSDELSFALPTDTINDTDVIESDNDDDLSLGGSNSSSILSFNIDDFIDTNTNNHVTLSVVSLCSLSYSDDEAEDFNSEDEDECKDQDKCQYQGEDETTNFYNKSNCNGLARMDRNQVDLVEVEVQVNQIKKISLWNDYRSSGFDQIKESHCAA